MTERNFITFTCTKHNLEIKNNYQTIQLHLLNFTHQIISFYYLLVFKRPEYLPNVLKPSGFY